MSGGSKMFLFFGYGSLFPFILLTVIAHLVTYRSCKKKTLDHLVSLGETKKREVEDYFTSIRKRVRAISEERVIIEATKYFTDNDPILTSVQHSPLAENQYHLKKRNKSTVGLILNNHEEQEYHHCITEYGKRFENFKIFIAEPSSGKIVFSNFQDLDLSISLVVEPYTKTNFGRAFQLADKSSNPGYVKVTDFEFIPPLYKKAVSFVVSPIYDDSEKVGILMYTIPFDEINSLMASNHEWESHGMVKTGKIYMTKGELSLMSYAQSSREKKKESISQLQRAGIRPGLRNTTNENKRANTFSSKKQKGVSTKISGEMDNGILPDYRKDSVMSSYTPLDIEDLNWGIVSEIDKTEVFSSVYLIRNYSFVIGGVYCIILTAFLIRTISNNNRLLHKRDESAVQNRKKQIFSPDRIRSGDLDMRDNKTDKAVSTVFNSENTSDFLKRCTFCSEREDILANECMDVINEIKNSIAKQSEQIYHICGTTQHAIYGQEDRYKAKKAKQGQRKGGSMDRSCRNESL